VNRRFRGPWIVAAVFISFGITVGLPYYGMPFFYDYFIREFGWTRPQITFGFPLAAVLTLWIGPVLVPRYSARRMLLIGTFCTFLAFLGFGLMGASLFVYYLLWALYRGGNIFCGPIPYQVILSEWYKKRRGLAIAIAYLGVGAFGGASAKYIAEPLTEAYGFRAGLIGIGVLMFAVWPLALFVLRDRPADIGQSPDGEATIEAAGEPQSYRWILCRPAFWLLLVGSFCSIGSIGAVNQHMKLIFQDQIHGQQKVLDDMYGNALLYIGLISNVGRLAFGYLADRFSKKSIMVLTYFLVAGSIPLLLRLDPPKTPWVFIVLFGLGMGADYMMVPLAAVEQFGLASLGRVMAVLLPADTIGQACVPYLIATLRQHSTSYEGALFTNIGIAFAGAIAVALLPVATIGNHNAWFRRRSRPRLASMRGKHFFMNWWRSWRGNSGCRTVL